MRVQRPQRLVPPQDRAEHSPEATDVERSAQAPEVDRMIARALRMETVDDPHPALLRQGVAGVPRRGEWVRAIRARARRPHGFGADEPSGDARHGGFFEKTGRREIRAEPSAKVREQPHGEQ